MSIGEFPNEIAYSRRDEDRNAISKRSNDEGVFDRRDSSCRLLASPQSQAGIELRTGSTGHLSHAMPAIDIVENALDVMPRVKAGV